MAENLDIDTAEFRRWAAGHDRLSAEIRDWAKPPAEWLASFESTYGKIAEPVRVALERYYGARELAGLNLAQRHADTATMLREAADAFDRNDADSGAMISLAGGDMERLASGDPAFALPGSGGPSGGGPVGPRLDDRQVTGGPGLIPVPLGDTGSSTGVGSPPPDGRATGTPGVTAAPGATTPAPAGGPVLPPPPLSMVPGATSGPAGERAQPPLGSSGVTAETPVPTPFAAAVAAAKDRAAEPSYVVGEDVDDDLVVARTLLSAVLAAVGPSVVGLSWAVSVMRGPAGMGVFITSNEGRGWLPAGVFLPRGVSTPWDWEEALGSDPGAGGSAWEGVADPARVLVEFGLEWGAKAGARLTALASAGTIDPGLRARLSDVPTAGLVRPFAEPDLRVPSADTIDRLGLTGSIDALKHAAAVPDSRVRSKCVGLAVDAHAQVGRTRSGSLDGAETRALRDRILAAVEADAEVPQVWWDELQDADALLAATMVTRRVDVSRVEVGQLRCDDDPTLRDLIAERRCNELVLLLAEEPTRQCLRDAVYAYEQIVRHPLFVARPMAVSVQEPADAGVAVTAPDSTAAVPPNGAVAAPTPGGPPSGKRSR
ncbi:type VII secretion target [Nocardia iowensis]|uniref:ESX-1 secretion-associated protein n=1 Tax=Nocardia iowensis TaxID=204891 RepID=A0ABX8RYC4_NOCIO|nr:type VII secretion target [Nocardia iowensis]QXN94664.1 ESX-1 secretion-associated protein [Nocardia iowensis]